MRGEENEQKLIEWSWVMEMSDIPSCEARGVRRKEEWQGAGGKAE